MLKKTCAVLFILFVASPILFAQQSMPQKYALVIGNGAYTDLTPLTNPVNDANDITAVLQKLGFSVDTVLNGTLPQMEDAVVRLRERLSKDKNTYGFFFYAGHGVQSGGENFLIPVDANIPGENYLRIRALSVQAFLDDLNDAGNGLNVVVLDACRDNPFGWSRSTNRGLAIVTRQPADSIIVYATSAGQRASDGEGRNGLFTSQLLKNLGDPSLEVMDVFRRTGLDVAEASHNQQIPAIYSQAFKTAYLGTPPAPAQPVSATVQPAAQAPLVPPASAAAPAPSQTGTVVKVQPSVVQPVPLPAPKEKKEPVAEAESRLWSVGASVGTSFNDPWLVGTVHGTIAPFNYSFLELGLDIGAISGASDAKLYSFYPFVHYAFFRPFSNTIGAYAGAGAGYLIAKYSFPKGDTTVNTFAADIIAGVNLFNMLDISYTFRTSFSTASSKVSVGYSYRFK